MYKVFVHLNLKLPNFLMGAVLISWGNFFFFFLAKVLLRISG